MINIGDNPNRAQAIQAVIQAPLDISSHCHAAEIGGEGGGGIRARKERQRDKSNGVPDPYHLYMDPDPILLNGSKSSIQILSSFKKT